MNKGKSKEPLTLRSGFGLGFSIMTGAILSGLLYGIGHSIGELKGRVEVHETWKATIDGLLEDISEKELDECEEE